MLVISDLKLAVNNRVIRHDFSLHLTLGEMVVMNGPSGSGKTSILRAICGFIHPVSGRIVIGNQLLDRKNIHQIRTQIAYLPQNLQIPGITAQEFLLQPFKFQANRQATPDRQKIAGQLNLFNLDDTILAKDFSSLSGGERQRLCFIAAVLLERPLLLLDEPTSALDPRNREILITRLDELKEKKAILIVSHDESVIKHADRQITLATEEQT